MGVGEKIAKTSVQSVAGALDAILKAWDKQHDKLRAAGITPKDIDSVRSYLATIRLSDKYQEGKKATAAQLTRERNQLTNETVATMRRIVAAITMAYGSDTGLVKSFEKLLPTYRATPRRKVKKG